MRRFGDILENENQRNHDCHKIIEKFLRMATGQPELEILVAHHIVFELPDEDTNEIPSTDTLMFNHELMSAVFAENAQEIMVTLVKLPVAERGAALDGFLNMALAKRKFFDETPVNTSTKVNVELAQNGCSGPNGCDGKTAVAA